MKEMKRILALVLCFVILVGMMPAIALNAEAADTTQYLFFATDRHENDSIIDTLLDQMSTVRTVEYACLGGDMVNGTNSYSDTTVLSEVSSGRSQLTAETVDIVAGNHDDNASNDSGTFHDASGWLYSGEDYHVYGVTWKDVQSESTAESAAQAFVDWADTLTDKKIIIVMSHMPLHSKRNDNNGAAYWHEALNDVAADESGNIIRDVIFLHGHNHTDDTANYAYDVNEGYSVYNYSGSEKNYYTYGTAGYLNANKEATLIAVNDSTVTLTRYNSSGSTETYATVTRVTSTDSGDGGTTTETKEVYVLVDTMTVGEDYLIANGNSGSVTILGQSSGSAQTATAEVKTSGDYTYIETADAGYIWNATESTNSSASGPRLINDGYAVYYSNGLSVGAVGTATNGAVYTRYWTYSDGQLACVSTNSGSTTYYLTYSNGYSMTSTATDGIYIYEKQTITVSSDGTVSGGGSTEGGDSGDSGDSGNTGGSTETVVGTGTYTTADDGSYQKVTFGSSTTEEKTVYVLTDTMTSGENYLIVDSNSTSGNALINSSNSVGNTTVTITSGSLTIDGATSTETYIVLDNSNAVWTAGTSGSNGAFKNGSYYLYHKNSNLSLVTSTSNTNWTWNGSSNYLYYSGGGTKYLVYNDGWDISETADNVYLYREETATVTTGTSVTYSVTASDIEHFYTAATDDTETVTITKSLADGTPEGGTYAYAIIAGGDDIIASIDQSTGIITFNGNEGTAQVKVSYSWTEGEGDEAVTYTIWQVIDVTATAPYYKVELCDPVTDEDGNTTYEPITAPIALKGVKANDTYSVWAVVKYYDGIIEDGEDGKDLGDVEDDRLYWVVSDESIATIDPATGVITFTGENYGTFDVTVYYRDADGNILCEDTITISATESQYVVPGDGTNDFPEYPEQGAIRFDKTAVAQGNFSQSGIAKVELSMTGVPYGSSVPTDVVIMVDMTTSMTTSNSVDDAQTAIENMLEALVYDVENDAYDKNIYVQVWSFKSDNDGEDVAFVENLSRRNITDDDALTAAKDAIVFSTSGNDSTGTCYDEATKKMEAIVASCTTDNVVAVFASDGEPTRYAYLNSSGTATETNSLSSSSWFNSDGSTTTSYLTEYYTYKLKTDKIPVYTVGINISDETEAAWILEHMSSEYDALGTTVSTETANASTDYFFTANANTTTDELSEVFEKIAASIREAATNVVVEDKIDSRYTMNFSLPSGVTADEAGMDDFYIQVLGYELDENNDRKDNPTVLEKFLFNSDGTITHTIGGVACANTCTHVTKDSTSKITGIDGTYFDYTVDANGDEFLTWTADKLDRTELALEYFVYLDHSAGEEAADQVDPGTYPTNEYATITYTNFNGKECQQKFPVPTMTWMGAKVTYVFYLVNEDGQPVNRAGKIIPFAEAIFVTDPVTYDVTWNEAAGIERLSADYLADGLVPDVYELYDEEAYYEIRVYQTEGVDEETKVVNYNYFVISGADNKLIDSAMDTDTTADNSTTKVYNTKAGVKYDEYGVYSQQNAGTVLNTTYVDENGNETAGTVTTTVMTDSIDYANTTVAFAVVWKPELVPDTVVVDYGLDVVIDVTTNDTMSAGVTGVSTTAPANVKPNSGTYKTSAMGTSTNILIDDLIIGTAKVENLNAVRFSLNKSSGMQFNEPVEFFYESECNYYTYDTAGNRTLNTDFMYSSVTVIPATSIYYEDEYVTLKNYELDSKDTDGDGDTAEYIETAVWDSNSVKASATQDQDRPGASKISADLDADNNYGFDAAYSAMSTYSMNNSAMTSVTAGKYATAEFTFYGTGFDIISLTDTTTGTIFVKVEDADGNSVKNVMVDTYYGYKMIKNEDGTISWETTTSNDPNALYQVPVIKVENLGYGKYTVTITASYVASFDNVADSTSYDFYLDAIRIYDPTGNENDVANDAYVKDGEGWPTYEEVRNNVIEQSTYDALGEGEIEGIVFIDGAGNTSNVADYASYGPNNELYLAPGQAINFTLTPGSNVAKVQMALKTVINSADVKIYTVVDGKEGKVLLDQNITTATDMYYTLWETVKDASGNYTQASEMNLVIMNDGTSGVLSITNVKTTYTSDPSAAAAPAMFMLRRASVDDALATLNVEEEVPETTVPEETEPETTVPETTEPETTVPEETEPETTVPEETESETTVPQETEPETTATEETEPSQQEQAEQVIRKVVKIIKGFLDWIFG